MKKILTAISGVVVACALSGCVSYSLKTQQEKERSALSNKQEADREVDRSEKALVVSTAITADATHRLKQARQKQTDANAELQNVLSPSSEVSF